MGEVVKKEITIDITGLDTIDLTNNIKNKTIGIINLTSSNANETIKTINGMDTKKNRFVFRSSAGLMIHFHDKIVSGGNIHLRLLEGSPTILNGDNGDFIELELRGSDVYAVNVGNYFGLYS